MDLDIHCKIQSLSTFCFFFFFFFFKDFWGLKNLKVDMDIYKKMKRIQLSLNTQSIGIQ